MKKPKALSLSIVIPVYNDEHHLKQCLTSIKKQTIKPDEVIVVDNNSTDSSMKVAKSYPFVKIVSEPKQGVVYARNRGFDAATSDIIGRIDADTVLPPDWSKNIRLIFTKDPNIAAVTGPTGYYDLPAKRTGLFITKIIRGALFYLARPKSKKYLFGANMAVRRGAWQTVRPFVCDDMSIHEDNDLAIHLLDQGFDVTYKNKLVAYISARRSDMSPRLAMRYAFSEHRAFRHHNMICIHAWLNGVILLILYPGGRLLYRGYDSKSGHWSLKRVFKHYEMRISPIN